MPDRLAQGRPPAFGINQSIRAPGYLVEGVEQFRIRRDKRARLLAEGHDPYPVAVERTDTLAQVRAAGEAVKPEDVERLSEGP